MSQITNSIEVLIVSAVKLNIIRNINEVKEYKSSTLNITSVNETKENIIGKCNRKKCKLCDAGNYKKCYNKSFISHPRAKYWSKKNNKNPRDVAKFSHKKYEFDCEECLH